MNRWWIWSVVAALRLCVLVLGSWCAARPVDLSTSGSECVEEPEITLDGSQRCIKYWTLVQQVHRLWTLMCAYICSDTSVKQKERIYFSFRSSFPRFLSNRKQTKDDGNLQKLLWSSERLHLFSLWMITIWILLWRHHDTGTNILCFAVMRNFLQITCIDQFILLEKWGWFCRGMHFIRRSKRALIYSTDREWLLLTMNAGNKLLKKTIRNIRHEKWEPCCDVDAELMYCDFLLTLRDVFFDIFVNFLG